MSRIVAKYGPRQTDLADACLIRMSELHPDSAVMTVDSQFRDVYRRNGRRVIESLMPEGVSGRRRRGRCRGRLGPLIDDVTSAGASGCRPATGCGAAASTAAGPSRHGRPDERAARRMDEELVSGLRRAVHDRCRRRRASSSAQTGHRPPCDEDSM